MAYKKQYAVLALLGISLASGAAWWWQNKAPAGVATPSSAASSSQGGPAGAPAGAASGVPGAGPAGGAGRAPVVEVAKVESEPMLEGRQMIMILAPR